MTTYLKGDPGFFKGGRACTKMFQFEDWNLIENCCTRSTRNTEIYLQLQ